MNSKNESNVASIAPVLLVRDIHASVEWYRKKLGCRIDKIWGEPPSFAMAYFGGSIIMLKQSENAPRNNAAAAPDTWDAYLWVRDLNAIARKLTAAKVDMHRGPEKTPYECEELEIRDPDGHILCFGYCW